MRRRPGSDLVQTLFRPGLDMSPTALPLLLSLCGALAVYGNPDEYSLRFVGGATRCRGKLQVQRSGEEWAAVDLEYVPLSFGNRLCAELGCGSAVGMEEKQDSEVDAVPVSLSSCKDRSLIHCFGTDTRRVSNVELICADSVRLVSGRSLCSGSLQIQDQSSDRSWTSVCEGALDRPGAEVLCRELGCGAPLLQGVLPPQGQMFQCKGHESALMDCPKTQSGPGTCSGPALNISCSEAVRLVGGPSRCEGIAEMEHRGEWRRIHAGSPWDLTNAAVVCQSLDCGSALSTEMIDLNSSTVWEVQYDCVRESASLRDCVHSESTTTYALGQKVRCSDSVRLVSGRSLCSGSLQIRDRSSDQSWTSVCEGALDRRGAEVLCTELGCGAPLLQGALSPLGQMFQCKGHESALMDCPKTQSDPGTCSGPALSLTCLEPMRLVAGASRCEGIMEVQYRGEWRRVSTFWYLQTAEEVCRRLDCGGAVNVDLRPGLNSSDAWVAPDECVRTAGVRDCVVWGRSDTELGVELQCTGGATTVQNLALVLVATLITIATV